MRNRCRAAKFAAAARRLTGTHSFQYHRINGKIIAPM
jgi:hypothetical protein